MADKSPPLVQFNLPKLEGLSGIKMGPGVMGRASSVCVPLGIAGSAVALALVFVQWWASLIALGMTFAAILVIMAFAFRHIDKNPDQALLEGAQLLKKHQMDQGARDPKLLEGSTGRIIQNSPPKSLTSDDRDA